MSRGYPGGGVGGRGSTLSGGQNHESLEKSGVGGTETVGGLDLLGQRWHGGKRGWRGR